MNLMKILGQIQTVLNNLIPAQAQVQDQQVQDQQGQDVPVLPQRVYDTQDYIKDQDDER